MTKLTLLTIILFSVSISIKAQNTAFNNVSIGTDAPAYGVKIKANFPGLNGAWARGFHITNESESQNYISLGSFGSITNGVSTILNSYIGTDHNNQYMTFLPNGKIGIGTTNPRANLDIAKYLSENQTGTVFGRLAEGDTTGSGTFLGVKGYATQGPDDYNVKSFSIVHDFYGQTNSSVNFYRGGSVLGGFITFNTSDNTEKMRIWSNGNVGIGTMSPDEKLTVKGKIHTQEVRVDMAGPLVPDYVFANDYQLKSLQEVEDYINKNKHLPEIPSAQEIEKNGLMLAEMNMNLLKKIEEMTLYSIQQNKKIDQQSEEIESLKSLVLRVAIIEKKLSQK
ncbi:hypothetical protein Flavo103_45330 [Flavobacterium collinsii]|jgi:hypothetical protein|uniref:tail fiber protein n=1 Tax=Flavobacterium collinsii TaxID=1114861 RepID=UPI0022C0B3A1|nr:tail fiber protein [Flavobacterium collinsii]GIQ61398.1 hypothetical protein Flavo103_45330 [Flavobacterium collinsii]